MEDVLVNFDIDACRIAYDGTRLCVSETFLRAVASGVVIARPQNESANHAKRLRKYAKELGYTIAIAGHDPANPGKTFKQLKAWEAAPAPDAPATATNLYTAQRPVREYEAPFDVTVEEIVGRGEGGRPPLAATSQRRWQNPELNEVEEGPLWGGVQQARAYVAPPVKRPRLMREFNRQFTYSSYNSREIVEVWRGQRRHPRADGDPFQMSGDYWRFEVSAQSAHQLSTGAVRWHPPFDHHDLEKAEDDANHFCLKDVVFQQLDMHPVRGAWNAKQKAFLASASDSEPLVFLDFIEDAALVVPKGCRDKLPRCMRVPRREEAGSNLFNRPPAGDAQWLPEDPPPPPPLPPPPPEREEGTVERWTDRGFGFIRPTNDMLAVDPTTRSGFRPRQYDQHIFCHVSDIEDGNCLRAGSTVTFVAFYDAVKGKERAKQVRGGITDAGARHSSPIRTCFNWQQGQCTRGAGCRFAHL